MSYLSVILHAHKEILLLLFQTQLEQCSNSNFENDIVIFEQLINLHFIHQGFRSKYWSSYLKVPFISTWYMKKPIEIFNYMSLLVIFFFCFYNRIPYLYFLILQTTFVPFWLTTCLCLLFQQKYFLQKSASTWLSFLFLPRIERSLLFQAKY